MAKFMLQVNKILSYVHGYIIDLATCTNTTSMVLDIHKMKKILPN